MSLQAVLAHIPRVWYSFSFFVF